MNRMMALNYQTASRETFVVASSPLALLMNGFGLVVTCRKARVKQLYFIYCSLI